MKIIYRTEDDRVEEAHRTLKLEVPWGLHSGNVPPACVLMLKRGKTITYDCVDVER